MIPVNTAEFVTSAVKPTQYPEGDYPEVAFAGRSNVGKSSLINRLVNRKGLVKTSSTPGRTQLINFFLVNGSFSLVDLPGYGYAKVPARIRAAWGPMVQTYLEKRENLRGVVLLQDFRRRPKDMDLDFMDWLGENNLPCILVATKTDKVKAAVKAKTLKAMLGALPPEASRPILFSALTGRGKEELWTAVSALLTA